MSDLPAADYHEALTPTAELVEGVIANPVAQTDTLTVRLVVVMLGLVVLGGLAGTVWLISQHFTAADLNSVGYVTTGALGALSAVLVSTRSRG